MRERLIYDRLPNDSLLPSTHPRHKHIPADIKHHRIPAPGMSFTQPNLLKLIPEIESLVEQIKNRKAEG